MSWRTPTLAELRSLARDKIAGKLKVGALLGNSRARFIADANAGLVLLCFKYLDWLADQIFPDLAGDEWLRGRHAVMWLGGSKAATYAGGEAYATGVAGSPIPAGTRVVLASGVNVKNYRVTARVILGSAATLLPLAALESGSASNLDAGTELSFTSAPEGVDSTVIIKTMDGGVDAEQTEDLRARVLQRIRNPPMGGAAHDYERWALEVPGVTRAWLAPLEMGIGTVTLRFMCDDLRAYNAGFPYQADVDAVAAYIDGKRPVTVKDRFIVAPVRQDITFTISDLTPDTTEIRAAIEASVKAMLFDKATPARSVNGVLVPAQKIYKAWISAAIMGTDGVESFDLTCNDFEMPHNGAMATLGSILYA